MHCMKPMAISWNSGARFGQQQRPAVKIDEIRENVEIVEDWQFQECVRYCSHHTEYKIVHVLIDQSCRYLAMSKLISNHIYVYRYVI